MSTKSMPDQQKLRWHEYLKTIFELGLGKTTENQWVVNYYFYVTKQICSRGLISWTVFVPNADLSGPTPHFWDAFLWRKKFGVGRVRSALGAKQFMKSISGGGLSRQCPMLSRCAVQIPPSPSFLFKKSCLFMVYYYLSYHDIYDIRNYVHESESSIFV